jgi:H+/Cl- antiporter ClcA
MNVNVLKNNPPWWWYLVFMFGTLGLTLVVWIVFKKFPDVGHFPVPV